MAELKYRHFIYFRQAIHFSEPLPVFSTLTGPNASFGRPKEGLGKKIPIAKTAKKNARLPALKLKSRFCPFKNGSGLDGPDPGCSAWADTLWLYVYRRCLLPAIAM